MVAGRALCSKRARRSLAPRRRGLGTRRPGTTRVALPGRRRCGRSAAGAARGDLRGSTETRRLDAARDKHGSQGARQHETDEEGPRGAGRNMGFGRGIEVCSAAIIAPASLRSQPLLFVDWAEPPLLSRPTATELHQPSVRAKQQLTCLPQAAGV